MGAILFVDGMETEIQKITVRQFSERTGIGRSTVNLMCKEGKLPGAYQEHSPVGKYWLIPESLVEVVKPKSRGRPSKDLAAATK